MSIVGNVTTLEQLGQQFTSLFERRAFRLETLDYYDAPNEQEPYAAFLAGQPVNPAWREPWKALVREVRASGRVMERVKVVSEPVSDYVRFSLLHASPASVEAGEDIRIIERWRSGMSGIWACDFWLFDDDCAIVLKYDDEGRIVRVTKEEDTFLQDMIDTRTEALRRSVPLAQYVAEHNITGRKHAA